MIVWCSTFYFLNLHTGSYCTSLPVCNFGPISCVSVSGHNLVVVPFGRSEFFLGSVSTYLFAPRGVWGVLLFLGCFRGASQSL